MLCGTGFFFKIPIPFKGDNTKQGVHKDCNSSAFNTFIFNENKPQKHKTLPA
jgi:hypothetical protein